jgi:hypothetical protein
MLADKVVIEIDNGGIGEYSAVLFDYAVCVVFVAKKVIFEMKLGDSCSQVSVAAMLQAVAVIG